jgi:peptidoglycan/xylan/chitin deacetylase (PgdA/CDA1 family)/SAM-dependent methyltransferase
VTTPHRGVCAARNIGVGLTTSPYVVLVDADDTLEAAYFERAAAILDANPSLSFVSCAMRCFGASDEVWTPPHPDLLRSFNGEIVHISSMFRRAMWQTLAGFDEDLVAHEDVDFWARALEGGFLGTVIPEPLLNYRVRHGSLYQRAIARGTHVTAMESVYRKHLGTLTVNAPAIVLAKEQFILDQRVHADHLREKAAAMRAEISALDVAIRSASADARAAGIATTDFGDLRQTRPLSDMWGQDRGKPLDRYYIERFLARHQGDIRGRVLEVKDDGYTRMFGGDRVKASDVVDVDLSNDQATIFADLTAAAGIGPDVYDCFILTQTLGLIFDVARAVAEAARVLKPGGVLLCTVPASGRISYEDRDLDGDYWRFTEASVRRLFAGVFSPEEFDVTGFGNVLACSAFLYGLAPDDLTPAELDAVDPYFPVVYGIRAVKRESPPLSKPGDRFEQTGTAAAISPGSRTVGAVLMYHRVVVAEEVDDIGLAAEALQHHLEYLERQGYSVVPLSQLARATVGGRQSARLVALTFDDGYAEMLQLVAPLLAERAVPATYFVVSEALGSPMEFWWDVLRRMFTSPLLPETLSIALPSGPFNQRTATRDERQAARRRLEAELYRLPRPALDSAVRTLIEWSGNAATHVGVARPMTRDELVELARVPGMSIGAHTMSHLWLPTLSPAERRQQILENKHDLEGLLNLPVTSLAYPYGGFDHETVLAARECGFREAVSAEDRAARIGDDPLRLPRLDVGSLSPSRFAIKLGAAFDGP